MRHHLSDELQAKQNKTNKQKKPSYGLGDYPDFSHCQVDSDVLLGFSTSLDETKFRVYFLTPQR